MTTALSASPAVPAPLVDAPLEAAQARRRFAAGTLDGALVLGGLALVLGTELALAPEGETAIFAYGWFLIFAPLYFALYHAYGTGATPGQLELRIGVRDETGVRPTLSRALGRAYVGFALVVVVPVGLLDLLLLAATGSSLRDRITGTRVVRIGLTGKAPDLVEPTAPELLPLFAVDAGTHRYLARGWALVRVRSRLLVGVAGALYGVFVALALVLAFLLVADFPLPEVVLTYVLLVPVLLGSSVYWVQAAIATAVEAVRVGRADESVWATLVRGARRANALSAALVLLIPVVFGALYLPWLLVTLVVAGRVALVAPALALEDTRVLGAFRRSWQLTRGRTWRTLGLFLLCGTITLGALGLVLLVAGLVFASTDSLAGALVGAVLVLVVTAPPYAWLLAWVGAAWALLYEDARRARPAGSAV